MFLEISGYYFVEVHAIVTAYIMFVGGVVKGIGHCAGFDAGLYKALRVLPQYHVIDYAVNKGAGVPSDRRREASDY